MDSSTPCCASSNAGGPRKGTWLTLVWLLYWCLQTAHAEGIVVRSADVAYRDNQLILNASHSIALTHGLEDALVRGVPLHFVTEFEVESPRWYFLNLWNETHISWRNEQRLTYNVITQQYRLSVGALHQNFDTLDEVLAILGSTRNRVLTPADPLQAGEVYIAGIRITLDVTRLPKPMQLNAIGSREWQLGSDWYRWTFKP